MKIVISAGPTREKIDPVRFITNFSSGKMGYALAAAARETGAETVLISGPTNLAPPDDVRFISVESAAEMAEAVKQEAIDADIVIMSAAVADYRPVVVHSGKMKKSPGNLLIELERTEDILASLGAAKPAGQILCGFAAETENILENAQDKLRRKNLNWIIANDVSAGDRGFAVDKNAVTMISDSGQTIDLPLEDKTGIARKIIKTILRASD